ncbi:MAG: hypothetical protein Q8N55_02270 [bacterium]|nr:hypothetical protein [bacterium]
MIKPHKKSTRLFFFIAGIIATIAYRIVIVLNLYSPFLVKVAWYIGTVGFIFYFGHRYDIARKRANLIKKYNLVEIIDNSSISGEEKDALHYLVQTTLTSKSRWNSAVIFLLTLVALIVAILIDVLM